MKLTPMKPRSFLLLASILFVLVFVIFGNIAFKKDIFRSHQPSPTIPATITSPLPLPATAINHGSRAHQLIALTFDADMTPGMVTKLKTGRIKSYYDKSIINYLKENNIPATIFVTGLWAQTYTDELKTIASDPLFEIGNHSYKHYAFSLPCYNLPLLSPIDKERDITRAQEIITSVTGQIPKLFRFPGGCYTQNDEELINQHGLTTVEWDVESGDAFNKKADSIVQHTIKKAQNGSIIVMHLNGEPNAPKTSEALPHIVNFLKNQGYTFVTVTNLLKEN